MRFKSSSIVGLAVLLSSFGCVQPAENITKSGTGEPVVVDPQKDPEAFLKWSMDQHAALKSFSVNADWKMTMDSNKSKPLTAKRTIQFVKPNKFKVVSVGGLTMTTICDGKEMIEYSSNKELGAMKIEAPTDISNSRSMQMNHVMFSGTMLYQYFGGSGNYSHLVDASSIKPNFGVDSKSSSGEELATVKFYAPSNFGNVVALISRKTGLVHSLTYDLEGIRKMAAQTGQIPQDVSCSETYSNWALDKTIDDSTFSIELPQGIKLSEVPAAGGPDGQPSAPFPIGSAVPNVELTRLDGKKMKLSDFRGSIVLIDFWATWCGPCVQGLPVTNKLHEELKSKGLKVITVSDEDEKTVADFIKDKGFTFDAFRDPERKANEAFKVNAIPTMVILDQKGRLLSYTVGLEPEEMIREKLKKAGVGF